MRVHAPAVAAAAAAAATEQQPAAATAQAAFNPSAAVAIVPNEKTEIVANIAADGTLTLQQLPNLQQQQQQQLPTTAVTSQQNTKGSKTPNQVVSSTPVASKPNKTLLKPQTSQQQSLMTIVKTQPKKTSYTVTFGEE